MAEALAGGMLGRGQQAIAPSLAAIGPTRYLRERDFLVMLGIAFAIHLAVLVIASLIPREAVKDIPVRALSFKLGGQVPRAAPMMAAPIEAPPAAEAPGSWRASAAQPRPVTPPPLRPLPVKPAPRPAPKLVKQPKIIPIVPPEKRRMPVENRTPQPLPTLPIPAAAAPSPPSAVTPSSQPLPSTDILTRVASPAIAPSPQRFTREVGAAPAAGVAGGEGGATGADETAESIRARYTQQISAWVKQHYAYPAGAGGAKGRVLVRIRITREGYLRYYAVEASSGHAMLDAAAIEMVKRANPMPAAPPGYTNDTLIEFRIPINFAPGL